MARILAIDYGKKRCGIAVTDELQIISTGLTTVKTPELKGFLQQYVASHSVESIVVGQPKRHSGEYSDIEQDIVKFIEEVSKVFPNLAFYREDERFTSMLAQRSMLEMGLKKKDRQNKELVDEISATIILQSFMERISNKRND